MIDVELLINRFAESPDSLGDEEYAALAQALEDSPDLAVQLREQLTIGELLAQKLDPDRQGFRAQIEQRLADLERGEEEIAEQISAMRELAIGQLRQPSRDSAGSLWRLPAIALALLIAAGLAIYFTWPIPAPIAKVTELEGAGTLLRGGIQTALSPGDELRDGDRLVTEAGAKARITYSDGTWVRIFEDTTVRVSREGRSSAKRVHIDQGRLAASIAAQPAGHPMLFISPTATAKVIGTELWLAVDKQSTELKVAEGKVEFWRSDAPQVVVVDSGETGRVTAGTLEVKAPLWPAERRSLAFAFAAGHEPALSQGGKSSVLHSTRLIGQGDVSYNSRGGMKLTGGSFGPEDEEVNRNVLAACRETNEITVEAVLRSERPDQKGPAQIVSFSAPDKSPAFSLGQQGNALVWHFKTDGQGDREFSLADLATRKTTHCMVAYRSGKLVCYIDGAKVFEDSVVTSGFANWKEQNLSFGAEPGGAHPWHGTLEGVAIYNRFFAEEDAQRSAAGFQTEYLHSTADGSWKELLPLASKAKHAVAGRWYHDSESVRCDDTDAARLMLPLAPDGNYELQVEFTRASGEEPFSLIFPVGQTQARLVLDGKTSGQDACSALELIEGKPAHDNVTTLADTVLGTGKRHSVLVSVVTLGGRCHVKIALDGEPLLEWSGATRSLTLDPRYQTPDRRLAALVSSGGEIRFHAARLRMLTGQAVE
jgi:hypothetical protein